MATPDNPTDGEDAGGAVEIPWSSDWLHGSSVPADDGSSRVLQVASHGFVGALNGFE